MPNTQPEAKGELEMADIEKEKETAAVEEAQPVDQKVLEQLMLEGRSNTLTALFVERPVCVLLVGFLTLFIISAISFALGYFDLTPQNNREFLVWTDQKVIDWDKRVAGKEAILAAQGKEELPVRMQNTQWWNPVILVNTPNDDESLLEKKNLLKMLEIENKIKELPDWPLFCKAKAANDASCADQAILSPLAYLKIFAGENWTEKTQEELDNAWKAFRNSKPLWTSSKFLYNKESMIDESGNVNYMRFLISFGAPLDMSSKKSLEDETQPGPRYRDLTDRERDQKKYVADF